MSTVAEPVEGPVGAWPREQFLDVLRAQGMRYHDLHPFHVRMNNGELLPRLAFKCELLWAQLDAIDHGDTQSRARA